MHVLFMQFSMVQSRHMGAETYGKTFVETAYSEPLTSKTRKFTRIWKLTKKKQNTFFRKKKAHLFLWNLLFSQNVLYESIIKVQRWNFLKFQYYLILNCCHNFLHFQYISFIFLNLLWIFILFRTPIEANSFIFHISNIAHKSIQNKFNIIEIHKIRILNDVLKREP